MGHKGTPTGASARIQVFLPSFIRHLERSTTVGATLACRSSLLTLAPPLRSLGSSEGDSFSKPVCRFLVLSARAALFLRGKHRRLQ